MNKRLFTYFGESDAVQRKPTKTLYDEGFPTTKRKRILPPQSIPSATM